MKKFILLFKFVWSHPLNYNNRLAALWRVISFQIASRINNAAILYPFVNNTQLFMKCGMTGATGNWYCGLQEYEDMGFVLHVLQAGDLFVDIGANIGSYSVLAGSCEGVNVVAFEPVSSTFSWLQKNIQVNKLDKKVYAKNIGLADQEGTIYFSSNLDTLNHVVSKHEKNSSSIEVDVLTLDDVMKEKSPTIIKIDTEGYESQILNGAKKTINNSSLIAILIELNGAGKKYGKEDNEICKLLMRKGFKSFSYDPLKRKLKSLNGKINKTSNTLFLRKLDEIQHRLSRNNTFMLGTGKKI
jgi:FkbM family methyltransferase